VYNSGIKPNFAAMKAYKRVLLIGKDMGLTPNKILLATFSDRLEEV